MEVSSSVLFLSCILLFSGCSGSVETNDKGVSQFNCPNQILSWAESVSETGKARAAHIFWPPFDPSAETIQLDLYAGLNMYCDGPCDVTEVDEKMYSFYQSTHYWGLERVFDETIQCDGVDVDIIKNGEDTTKRQVLETTFAKITTTWKSNGCALLGGPRTTQVSGCISIKTEPK